MWPTVLNMTRDECRRTLRRLELETYAHVVSVFRAQGSLEESRKKILDDLRGVLHIGRDRHTAEARRVANDEILASIANQLTGPNSELSWTAEGRRLIPLMPRSIPETAFTEIADSIASQIKAEDKSKVIKNNLEICIDSSVPIADYAVVHEDPSAKIVEEELQKRKRKCSESVVRHDEGATPAKNIRNTMMKTNQKHHNIGLIYSSFSAKPPPAKMTPHSKHAYNQVAKVPSKGSQTGTPRPRKPRAPKQPKQPRKVIMTNPQIHSADIPPLPRPPNNPLVQYEYTNPGATYLGSYIQSLSKPSTPKEEIRINRKSGIIDPSTMKLLCEEDMIEHPDEKIEQPQGTVIGKHVIGGKACQLIIKKKENAESNTKPIIQLKQDPIKPAPTRSIVVTNCAPKYINSPARIATPKPIKQPSRMPSVPPVAESVVVATTSPNSVPKMVAKNVVVSTSDPSPTKEEPPPKIVHMSPNPEESKKLSDHTVNPRTFLLNQKIGQKMLVLKGKGAPKSEGQTTPVILKGMPMKLLPVNSPSMKPYNNIKVIPNTNASTCNQQKIIKLDTIRTAPNIKQSPAIKQMNSKNVVVLPKGSPIVKPVHIRTNEFNKTNTIKNSPQISPETSNVVVIGVNSNVQITENMSSNMKITEDTPIIFENEVIEELCNTNSMGSTTDTDSEHKENHSSAVNDSIKDNDSTDWEMESDNKSEKLKNADESESETDLYLIKEDNKGEKENSDRNNDVTTTVQTNADLYRTSRTLLSQLQDDCSSSTDSSFTLKSKSNSEEPKQKFDIKKPLHKPRSDIYSSGLATAEMKLDSFEYLEDEIMSGDQPIEIQLSQLINDNSRMSVGKQ